MILENNNDIHVGSILKKYVDTNKIYKSALARTLEVNASVVLAYEKRAGVNTATLLKLSHALQHNFFADIAALLPKIYSTTAPIDNNLNLKIAALEQEIIILKAEKGVLLEVLGR